MMPEAGRRLPFAIAVVAALVAGAFGLAAALTSAPPLILTLNALAVTMTAGVLWRYLPFATVAFWRAAPGGRDWLTVGALGLALAFLVSRLVSIAARDFGLVWIVDSDLISLRVAVSLFSVTCLLVAPFAGVASLARRWRDVVLCAAAGLVLAGMLVLMHRGHPPPLLPAAQGRS